MLGTSSNSLGALRSFSPRQAMSRRGTASLDCRQGGKADAGTKSYIFHFCVLGCFCYFATQGNYPGKIRAACRHRVHLGGWVAGAFHATDKDRCDNPGAFAFLSGRDG